MHSRKRKQRPEHKPRVQESWAKPEPEIDPSLFVVAHEADIVRGPQAELAAEALEVVEYIPDQQAPRRKIGSALVKWGASAWRQRQSTSFDDEDDYGSGSNAIEEDEIWVDRYDARLLLDALPPVQTAPPRVDSPSGWSDLPSDAEDTFFFSRDEAEDYQREKRRRTIDQAREERLKARLVEDEEDEKESEEDVWGGSDEEPDDSQRELMRRTAAHLHSSPNPAQLEMRILANHGADKRFAFLRGRWSRAWRLAKYKVKLQAEEATKKDVKDEKGGSVAIGALAGYGDSDDDDASGSEGG